MARPATMYRPRCRIVVALALCAWLATTIAAYAAAPLGGPVRLVVAYPPGGVSDAIARALAERAAPQLGTPVIVEHRAGAGGLVAMELLRHAPPDGRTLVFSAVSPLTTAPRLAAAGFDPDTDVTPVMSVMVTPVLVLGTSALRGDTLAEAVAMARASPGAVRWATSGVGTTGHRVLEQVRAASGADITHVPYKGGGQQIADAVAGEFEVLSSNVGQLQFSYVREGRLKALAVGAPTRLDVLPGVPTLSEAGFPGANLSSTFGLFAPGRTPPQIVAVLNRAFNAALRDPAIQRRLSEAGSVATGGTTASFAEQIARDRAAARSGGGGVEPPAR
jgi:tripartite-type tricarboxylate transporter receptor subunit TctC